MSILDKLLVKHNYNYSELAKLVGLGRTAVHRYFRRERPFPLHKTNEFAKAFNVTPAYLLGFEKDSELHTIYNQLNKTNQIQLNKVAQSLLIEQTQSKKDQ